MAMKVSLRELLEAGCHFGHQKQRWHPKAKEFIYTERDGVHIIDLAKTAKGIEAAYNFLKDLVSTGGMVIFLGSKRQAKATVLEEAKRCGAFHLVQKWPGGLFTNWEQIKKNIERIKELKGLTTSEEAKNTYTKREILLFTRELSKLLEVYGGIEALDRIPEAIYIVDSRKENNAVRESVKKGVKIIGVVDTNTDPTQVDYPIPANDDAVGSIKLITKCMADAVLEGKSSFAKASADAKAMADKSEGEEKPKRKTRKNKKEVTEGQK